MESLWDDPAVKSGGEVARERPLSTRTHTLGAEAEHLAIARLLELGHQVAIPVVDEGIDLVVNVRTAVQVKRGSRNNQSGVKFTIGSRVAAWRIKPDVYMVYAPWLRSWWVIPIAVLERVGIDFSRRMTPVSISLHPRWRVQDRVMASHELAKWREAWEVFDG